MTRNKPLPSDARDSRPKPYLRFHNLKPEGHNVCIRWVDWVEFYNAKTHERENVLGVYFYQKNGGENRYLSLHSDLIVDQMMDATGEKSPAKWVGKIVKIYPAEEKHSGKMWEVIRVAKKDASLPDAFLGDIAATPDKDGPAPAKPQPDQSEKEF